METPWIAALVALFVWWFSTGAILWAVKRADGGGTGAHGRSVLYATPVLVLGVAGTILSADRPDVAYGGFLSALAVWGWIEMAFLTGCVTGPIRGPMPLCVGDMQRFRAAWRALAWHELLLLSGLVFVAIFGNSTAAWTYAVLFAARISAKLNIFFGVPRINTEFLPRPLAHLPSYFRQGPPSWFFPLSVMVLTLAVFCWIERTLVTGEVHFALLAALTALALFEHWLMVLPLPDAKLWRWAMPAPRPDMTDGETRHGF